MEVKYHNSVRGEKRQLSSDESPQSPKRAKVFDEFKPVYSTFSTSDLFGSLSFSDNVKNHSPTDISTQIPFPTNLVPSIVSSASSSSEVFVTKNKLFHELPQDNMNDLLSNIHKDGIPIIPWSRIRLGKELGSGAYGKVRKGTLTLEDGQEITVAVKLYKIPDWITESRALRDVGGCDCVPKLFGLTDSDPVSLVMQYIDGETLSKFFWRQPLRQCLQAIVTTCSAVGDLHAAGYAHGDLHCDNVMVTDTDGGYEAYVIDLGFATALKDQDKQEAMFLIKCDEERLLWILERVVDCKTNKSLINMFGVNYTHSLKLLQESVKDYLSSLQ